MGGEQDACRKEIQGTAGTAWIILEVLPRHSLHENLEKKKSQEESARCHPAVHVDVQHIL